MCSYTHVDSCMLVEQSRQLQKLLCVFVHTHNKVVLSWQVYLGRDRAKEFVFCVGSSEAEVKCDIGMGLSFHPSSGLG